MQSVVIRCVGDDPLERKASSTGAFVCAFAGGRTATSASGLLFGDGVVLTTAAVLAPWLQPQPAAGGEAEAALLPGTRLHVLLRRTSEWVSASLSRLLPFDAADAAVATLRLAADGAAPTSTPSLKACFGALALLAIESPVDAGAHSAVDALCPHVWDGAVSRGDHLLLRSTPYGAVAPAMLADSVASGVVSNIVPVQGAANMAALVLADMRCLPGSAGGPVWRWCASCSAWSLFGLVAPPLPGALSALCFVLPLVAFPDVWLPPVRMMPSDRKSVV